MIYITKKLGKKEMEKLIKKAMDRWRNIALRDVDDIKIVNVKLPRILHKGRIIDLQQKYKDAVVVCTKVGEIIGFPYIARKGDSVEDKFIHFNETPVLLVVDPEDNTRLFLAYGDNLRVTDRGIEG